MYALVPKTRMTPLARNISHYNCVKVDHNILELGTFQAAKRNNEKNARTAGISAPGAVEDNLGIEQKEGEKIGHNPQHRALSYKNKLIVTQV